ncbi:hypothetical protein [Tangfeifania diversioriginum]|uniref:hypothetical protein n=1 Tax=Tangfeifania diversioriginum TaxID=1168035 RepID=UPI001114ABB4|nr:hypothetical protein [Tangfeifania diversioriginum]
MGYKAFDSCYSLAGNRSGYRLLFCGIFCVNVPVPILCKAVIYFRRTCTYGVVFAHFLYWTIDTLKQYNWRAAARYFFREPVREKSSKKPLESIVKCKKTASAYRQMGTRIDMLTSNCQFDRFINRFDYTGIKAGFVSLCKKQKTGISKKQPEGLKKGCLWKKSGVTPNTGIYPRKVMSSLSKMLKPLLC